MISPLRRDCLGLDWFPGEFCIDTGELDAPPTPEDLRLDAADRAMEIARCG